MIQDPIAFAYGIRRTFQKGGLEAAIKAGALPERSIAAPFEDVIYRRFVADDQGEEVDDFGRKGLWIPRGCIVYYDRPGRTFVKVFDSYAAINGEARFLQDALDNGLYSFLCPNLDYLIVDENENLRGYAIREGESLTRYEFERYVGGALREVRDGPD